VLALGTVIWTASEFGQNVQGNFGRRRRDHYKWLSVLPWFSLNVFLSVGESRSWNEVCAQVLPCTISSLSFTLLMLPKLSLVSHNVAELLSSIAAVPRNISSLQKLCLYLFSDCLSQPHRHTAEDGCLCHKDTPRHYLNSCPPTLEKYTSSWE
jgi:hypothetical protein